MYKYELIRIYYLILILSQLQDFYLTEFKLHYQLQNLMYEGNCSNTKHSNVNTQGQGLPKFKTEV